MTGSLVVGMWAAPGDVRGVASDARYLEDRGLDSIWTGEQQDALVTAGAVAAVTSRARIGTGIAQISRSPAQMAIGCLNLQLMTGGRFELGIGLGGRQSTNGWHQVPWTGRARRIAEYARAVRTLLSAPPRQPIDFSGEFYQIHRFVRFETDAVPVPPIWIAAAGPQSHRAAGAAGDGILLINMLSIRYYLGTGRDLIARGARSAGRDPAQVKVGFVRYTAVDTERTVARERVRAALARSAGAEYHQALLRESGYAREAAAIAELRAGGDLAAAQAIISDEMIDEFGLCGTPDDLRKSIARYRDVADLVLLHPAAGDLTPIEQNAHNRAIADAVGA